MADILIGTSGFSYTDWCGPVYAAGTRKNEFLPLYAAEFSLVELNFSYYRQPDPRTIEQMIKKTPENFSFAIKAHQSLTHQLEEDFSEAARIFKEGIKPLIDYSRLAAVLFQFPYSFHYTPESRRHLEKVCRVFEDMPVAIEFRNREWQKDTVYAGLREYNAAYVCVDEPDLNNLPAPIAVATSDLGYVRFHGRNKQNWWKGDNTTRYDYLYSSDELKEWLDKIDLIAEKVRILLITFNNHRKGQAVFNARELTQLLSDR